jgi:hypothetical protein
MDQKRLMKILQVTIANLCDVANGDPVDTEMLWGLHTELEQAIREG